MRPFWIVGLAVLLSRDAAAQEDSARQFDISSETSLYEVRGRLAGKVERSLSELRVVVSSGSVLAMRADPRLQLRVIIAAQGGTSWKKVVESEPQPLGAFVAGERRDLSDSLVFTLAVPPDLDLQRHWLAFQFARSDKTTTYACSERNLAGPDSLSAGRAQQLRTFYPLAC